MKTTTSLSANAVRLFVRAIALAILSALSTGAAAHPHVWISYAVTAQTKDNKVIALSETWVFSKGFPVSLAGDFSHMPTTGPFDAKHTALIYDQAFSALRGMDYFTHVYVDGQAVPLSEAKNFSASIENHHMVYRFLVPLKTPVELARGPVEIGIWDDTFFVDFEGGAHLPLTLDAAASRACKTTTFEDQDHPIFGGSINPLASRISC